MQIQASILLILATTLVLAKLGFSDESSSPDVDSLLTNAIELTRGKSSYAEMEMTIHRPEWTRSSAFNVWTRGLNDTFIEFTAPPRDAGNATLKKGNRMWTYSPKIRRTIRLPSSMMSQKWAGSDFSYSDLSRSDEILNQYSHTLVAETVGEHHTIFTIEAIPNENSPVVWGKEELQIRDDFVILSHSFFDQSMELVKTIQTLEIGILGERILPIRMRVSNQEEPDKWTEIRYKIAEFDIDIDDKKFSLFSLRENN